MIDGVSGGGVSRCQMQTICRAIVQSFSPVPKYSTNF